MRFKICPRGQIYPLKNSNFENYSPLTVYRSVPFFKFPCNFVIRMMMIDLLSQGFLPPFFKGNVLSWQIHTHHDDVNITYRVTWTFKTHAAGAVHGRGVLAAAAAAGSKKNHSSWCSKKRKLTKSVSYSFHTALTYLSQWARLHSCWSVYPDFTHLA